jgi:hypothetical protein
MRHTFLLIIVLSFVIVFQTGCTKGLKEGKSAEVQSNSKYDHTGNAVRLTYGENLFGGRFYEYNEDGLIDNINSGPGFTYFGHEYDANGKLIKAQLYPNNVFNLYIDFFYSGNDVTRQVWYLDGEMLSEYFYHYNAKGQMYYAESSPSLFQYHYEYTPDGNISQFTTIEEGRTAFSVRFTYGKQIKNPFSAVPGFPFDYNSSFGFYVRNKWHPTSEVLVFYDEAGKPITFQEFIPQNSVILPGPSNYAASSDYFDILSGFTTHREFIYGNCGSCKDKKPAAKDPSKIDFSTLFEFNSPETIIQRVDKIKKQLKAKGLIK